MRITGILKHGKLDKKFIIGLFIAESFEPHYGEGGRDGDGDVFKEANIKEFTNFVLQNTDGLGKNFIKIDFLKTVMEHFMI